METENVPSLRFDFKKYFEIDILRLKYSGTWAIREGEEMTVSFVFFMIAASVFCVFFNLFQILNLLVGAESIKDVASNGYVVLIGLMSLVKSFCIFKNRRTLSKVLLSLNDVEFQSRNVGQDKIVSEALQHFRTLKRSLLSMTWTAVISSMATPLFYKKNDNNLPFAAWYPFDISKSPLYELVYACQCVSDIFVSSININVEILVMALMIFIGMQCDLMSHSMMHYEKEKDCRRPVKEYVVYHKKIIQ